MSRVSSVAAAPIIEKPPVYMSRGSVLTDITDSTITAANTLSSTRVVAVADGGWVDEVAVTGEGVLVAPNWTWNTMSSIVDFRLLIDGVAVWEALAVPDANGDFFWPTGLKELHDKIPFSESFKLQANVITPATGVTLQTFFPYRLNV